MSTEEGNEKISESNVDEFTIFLGSTGKVRPSLAKSLKAQGLDEERLLSGDRKYFLTLKGVGEKTADALMALSEIAKAKNTPTTVDLWEHLRVNKVRSNVVKSLKDAGMDTPEKIKDAGKDGLTALPGIGDATAEGILNAVSTMPSQIEDASAEQAPGEVQSDAEGPIAQESLKKGSIIDRIGDFFRSLFRGKKQVPVSSEEAPVVTVPEESDTPLMEDIEAAMEVGPDTEADSAPEEPTPGPEAPAEAPLTEVGDPIPEKGGPPEDASNTVGHETTPIPPSPEGPSGKDEEVPGEISDEERSGTETPLEPAESTGPASAPEEPPKNQPGFFQRIMSFFKKTPSTEEPKEKVPIPVEGEGPVAGPSDEVPEGAEPVPDEPTESIAEGEKGPEEPERPPEEVEIKEIEDIPGIDPSVALKLRDAGYQNLDELKEAVPDDLVLVEGIERETAERICSALKKSE